MYICRYTECGIFIDVFNVSGKNPNRQAFSSESSFFHSQVIERVMSMHRFLSKQQLWVQNTHLIYELKWLIEYVPSSTGR